MLFGTLRLSVRCVSACPFMTMVFCNKFRTNLRHNSKWRLSTFIPHLTPPSYFDTITPHLKCPNILRVHFYTYISGTKLLYITTYKKVKVTNVTAKLLKNCYQCATVRQFFGNDKLFQVETFFASDLPECSGCFL